MHAPDTLAWALTKAKLYEQGKGETKKSRKKSKRYESSSDESSNSSESEDEKSRRKRKEKKESKKKNKKPTSNDEFDDLAKRFEKLQINLMQQINNISK